MWECPECGEDRRCQRPVKAAGNRCRVHGGATPYGPFSANYKGRDRSSRLPRGLTESYLEARADPDLLSLEHEIAVIDAREDQLMEQLRDGGADALYGDLKGVYRDLRAAIKREDVAGQVRLLMQLGELIDQGAEASKTWDRFIAVTEQKRRLVDAERRRRMDMQASVAVEGVLMLITTLSEIIRARVFEFVADRDGVARPLLTAIANDLRPYLFKGAERQPEVVDIDGEIVYTE